MLRIPSALLPSGRKGGGAVHNWLIPDGMWRVLHPGLDGIWVASFSCRIPIWSLFQKLSTIGDVSTILEGNFHWCLRVHLFTLVHSSRF